MKGLRLALLMVPAVLLACSDSSGVVSRKMPASVTPGSASISVLPPSSPATDSDQPSAPHEFPLRTCAVASWDSFHHDYPAADIFAPEGTAFVAVTNGVVDWVSRTDRWDPVVDDPADTPGRTKGATRDGSMAGIEGRTRPRLETSGTPCNAGCVSSGSPSPVSGAATGEVARTPGRRSTQRSGSNMTAAMSTPQERIDRWDTMVEQSRVHPLQPAGVFIDEILVEKHQYTGVEHVGRRDP